MSNSLISNAGRAWKWRPSSSLMALAIKGRFRQSLRRTDSMVDFLIPLISATAGLGGVFLGGWLSDRREREKRRNDFITRQLSEFYGPLVSMRAEIRARGDLRLQIETAIDEKHARDLIEAGSYGGQSAIRQVTDDNIPPMLAVMRDEYKIFTDVSMPL